MKLEATGKKLHTMFNSLYRVIEFDIYKGKM